MGIAAIGLTFKAEPGIEDIYLDSILGQIAIPDMTRFARVGNFSDGPRPQSLAAHILGEIGTSYEYSTLPSEPLVNTPIARNPYAYWDAGDHWEYVFTKSAPIPGASSHDFNFLAVYSDQAVQSSAICAMPARTFDITSGVLTIRNTETNKTVIFPAVPVGDESMTYLTEPILRGTDTGSNATSGSGTNSSAGSCGPGCSTVYVVEPRSRLPEDQPSSESTTPPTSSFLYYYECNITIEPSTSSNVGIFNLNPAVSAVAAQSIALSGLRAPLPLNATSGFSTAQYTAYIFGLEYGQPQRQNTTAMARMLSRYAIGTIAAAARTNPSLMVSGNEPKQGVRLVLDKPFAFGGVLVAAVAVQLVLLFAAVGLVKWLGGT